MTLEKNVEVDNQGRSLAGGVVSWSPPQPNWNPWTSCNIDEGPLAAVNIFPIIDDLKKNTAFNA